MRAAARTWSYVMSGPSLEADSQTAWRCRTISCTARPRSNANGSRKVRSPSGRSPSRMARQASSLGRPSCAADVARGAKGAADLSFTRIKGAEINPKSKKSIRNQNQNQIIMKKLDTTWTTRRRRRGDPKGFASVRKRQATLHRRCRRRQQHRAAACRQWHRAAARTLSCT